MYECKIYITIKNNDITNKWVAISRSVKKITGPWQQRLWTLANVLIICAIIFFDAKTAKYNMLLKHLRSHNYHFPTLFIVQKNCWAFMRIQRINNKIFICFNVCNTSFFIILVQYWHFIFNPHFWIILKNECKHEVK